MTFTAGEIVPQLFAGCGLSGVRPFHLRPGTGAESVLL